MLRLFCEEQADWSRDHRFMKPETVTYRADPRHISVFGFVLCSVLALLVWAWGDEQHSWERWLLYAVSVVLGFIAIMLIFYKEVSIDRTGRLVIETTLLFGLLKVRAHSRPFSEFNSVCYFISDTSDGGLSTWVVALDPQVGYPLHLRHFFSTRARSDAEEFATELGRTTGLDVKHETVKALFRFSRTKHAKG